MAIGADDSILKFGTQDEVTSGTPATIANNAYGKADQGASVNWTNDDDARYASAVLKCQFDTTFPSEGSLELYARLLNVQSTNDLAIPDEDYPHFHCGTFPIDFDIAADTDFYTAIPDFEIPMMYSAQAIDWYIKNNKTSQTMGNQWQLWITPKTDGPHP